jgi:TonB family protein
MSNNTRKIPLLPLILLFLPWANIAVAQQRIPQMQKADQHNCGKQPRHEAGTPKMINFCACLPTGHIYADPASEGGEVDIQFDVDINGALIGVRLLKSSGYMVLDRHVLKAVPTCRFEPAYKDGKAVRSFLIQRYIIENSDEVGENGQGLRVENGSTK